MGVIIFELLKEALPYSDMDAISTYKVSKDSLTKQF